VVDLTPAAVDQNLFDDAFGVFALPDGKILAGGVHNNPDESNSPAAIRLFGRSIEGNGDNPPDVVIDVENPNLSYEDVQNMTFPGLSRDAAFYIKSQPNPLGQVTLNLGDGNDVVNFFMTKDANGKDVIAVDVNGIVLYYDPAKMRLFTILGHGGNDKILGSDSITVPMVVDGGAGNDTEIGGGGNDLFTEGLHAPGTATLFDDGHEEHDDDDCDSHGDGGDLIKGGAGVDTMDYSSRTTNINVGLGTTADDGAPDEHDNVWMDVENVKTGSGNDIIRGQHNPGGNVDNTFDAGAGNDILIGMDGNDHLLGGPGRDILFGGNGADNLEGGTEDDILASGPTKYDLDNQSALAKIQKEWTSTSTSYANRVLHIRNGSGGLNGSNKLKAGSTALNDTSIDQLTGGAGQDWFFADTTGGDVVTDRNNGGPEVLDEL